MPDKKLNPRRGMRAFGSEIVDRARKAGNSLSLQGGQVRLPKVFGFCRGVERALEILEAAVADNATGGRRLFLLGEIIHNPWVNEYFQSRGVTVLTPAQRDEPEKFLTEDDCAVIPAFGVPLPVQRRLEAIGCQIVDTTCGDVRRLWKWAEQAARAGYGVCIFGRANHDETVVTKSRLSDAGGKYIVAGNLDEVGKLCNLITGQMQAEHFSDIFGPEATNAASPAEFQRLAQVSQTTMLYDETIKVREILNEAFSGKFGAEVIEDHLLFQPTVCRATQARQSAAVELCQGDCDLAMVVGGFGSSNTRHLFELASGYAPAFLLESADAIKSADQLDTFDFDANRPVTVSDWLPEKRPLNVAVLAGASSPEIVVGQVIERLAELLAG